MIDLIFLTHRVNLSYLQGTGNVVSRHSADETASSGAAQVSEQADEVGRVSGLGCDVIWLVVRVGAGEGLATRDGQVRVQGEELLDTLCVIGVDDGGDVKVRGTSVSIETDLTKHTGNIGLSLGDRIEIADPARGEGLVRG